MTDCRCVGSGALASAGTAASRRRFFLVMLVTSLFALVMALVVVVTAWPAIIVGLLIMGLLDGTSEYFQMVSLV